MPRLTEMNLRSVRETPCQVAILPWGATEPHNLHLPYGTDTFQAEAVAARSAELAAEVGCNVVVLPAIPIGVNAQQLDFPMTLNLNPGTQAMVLRDVVRSLERGPVRRLLILNGHGGNDFKPMIRELQAETEVFLCAAEWYRLAEASSFFDVPGDHAGELETSVMMHLFPNLVLPLDQAGPGAARSFRIEALRTGKVWAPRHWASVTDDSGVGDPSAATAEKGRAFFEAVTTALAGFLVELASADLNDMYGEAD